MQHLLRLDSLPPLPNHLRNMRNLDDGVGLDNAQEVLLEQCVVQRGKM